MPLKPLDKPVRKKKVDTEIPEKVKKPVSPTRITIIGLTILFSLIFSKVITLQPPKIASSTPKAPPNTGSLILDIKKEGAAIIATAQKEGSQIIRQVLGENTKNLKKLTDKPVESVSDYVFAQAVGGILNHIKKLPERQQKLIKKQICK